MKNTKKIKKDIAYTNKLIKAIDELIEAKYKKVTFTILVIFIATLMFSLYTSYNLAKYNVGYILAFLVTIPIIPVITSDLLKLKLKFDNMKLKRAKL